MSHSTSHANGASHAEHPKPKTLHAAHMPWLWRTCARCDGRHRRLTLTAFRRATKRHGPTRWRSSYQGLGFRVRPPHVAVVHEPNRRRHEQSQREPEPSPWPTDCQIPG